MPDELTKTLLLEEVASEEAVAEALLASVVGGVPLVQALLESSAVTESVLDRYLSRSDAPFVRQVTPVAEVLERLPPGLCARLFVLPIRRDAITGTIDIAVADAADPHPAKEIAFHLGAPVRVVRASVASIEDGLRRLRSRFAGPPGHVAQTTDVLRPSRPPGAERHAHVVPGAPGVRRSTVTPPWGTQVHSAQSSAQSAARAPSEPPRSALGSEIPIPLTRRTFTAVSGGTQRPPPLVDPSSSLGEGYAVDADHFRQIVELNDRAHGVDGSARVAVPRSPPVPSFLPGAPPVPGAGSFNAYAAQIPFADIGGILATLRAAGSRDEVLELVLTGGRMVAFKVAVFVVKRGGYLGWACTPEFGDRASLQSVLVPVESRSVFDDAVRDGLYLGAIRHDEVHAALLHVMRGASRDVAAVPIRVSGKTAAVVLADELGDSMLATRRLEELARAAGEAFTRIVRMRR